MSTQRAVGRQAGLRVNHDLSVEGRYKRHRTVSQEIRRPRTLNIGCGDDSWGDVRIDVTPHSKATLILDLDKEPIPFPAKYFEEVRLWHVLEHSKNPQRLLSEAIRVGKQVHAKFPYKWDRIPFVLGLITSMKWHEIRTALVHCFWHMMTQLGLADHPIAHRWMIQPFGRHRLNEICIPTLLAHGRKARFTRRFVFRLKAEWECWLG